MSEHAAPPRISGLSFVRPLGEGGFANVYLYEQDLPRRMVAVKALKSGIDSVQDRADFQIETDAMARLSNHPAIVSIYEAGISVDGRPYVLMEYCPGSMRQQTRGRPAQLEQVLDVGVRLAGALETAHRSGVLHRDIKPANVLITTLGRPALSDFGIAALSGRNSSVDSTTAVTIPWSAPEVLQGKSTGSVASEVWSLGAALYTFAAGHSPFELPGTDKNTRSLMMARITRATYTPIPGASGYERFDAVLKKAMMRDPEERYISVDQFAGALQQLQRSYGFDVTPFEMKQSSWPDTEPVAATPGVERGPVRSEVVPAGRAGARAAAQQQITDRDGLTQNTTVTPLRAGLIGAGITVAVLAAVAVTAALLGLI